MTGIGAERLFACFPSPCGCGRFLAGLGYPVWLIV
jgi:hypothetical protein